MISILENIQDSSVINPLDLGSVFWIQRLNFPEHQEVIFVFVIGYQSCIHTVPEVSVSFGTGTLHSN